MRCLFVSKVVQDQRKKRKRISLWAIHLVIISLIILISTLILPLIQSHLQLHPNHSTTMSFLDMFTMDGPTPTYERFVDKSSTNGDPAKPKVLIVGAGIAGLTLGILLHKANIPFEIFERCYEMRPYGTDSTDFVSISPYLLRLDPAKKKNNVAKILIELSQGQA